MEKFLMLLWLALLLMCSIPDIVLSKSKKYCIPVNVCTNTESKMGKITSQQYICDTNKIVKKEQYKTKDCQGKPDIVSIVRKSDPNYGLIKCSKCNKYIKYKGYKLPIDEVNCDNRDSYGYKEELVTYNCQKPDKHYSQLLTCTNDSFTMKWWNTNSKCKGKPDIDVTIYNGCTDVSFKFFQDQNQFKSFVEMQHCGYKSSMNKNDHSDHTEL